MAQIHMRLQKAQHGAHAKECRFYNCAHLHEPGCGVINVVENG